MRLVRHLWSLRAVQLNLGYSVPYQNIQMMMQTECSPSIYPSIHPFIHPFIHPQTHRVAGNLKSIPEDSEHYRQGMPWTAWQFITYTLTHYRQFKAYNHMSLDWKLKPENPKWTPKAQVKHRQILCPKNGGRNRTPNLRGARQMCWPLWLL